MVAAITSPAHVTNTHTTESLEPTILTPEVTYTCETAPADVLTLPRATNTPTAETLDRSTPPPLENTKTGETMEKSVMASDVTDHSHDNLIACHERYQGRVMRQETAEEVRSVLKVIAATGKFWYNWEKLRSMLSLYLMQVISEYPQAKMTIEEQKISFGETHAELAKRLDDALHSFVDGPPFTLQRISEIILDARMLYPNLSKLALALKKNLSVTSTLTISTYPYLPSLMTAPNRLDKETKVPNPHLQSDTTMENGAPPVAVAADRDETMTEVEADVSNVLTTDVETTETPSESSLMTTDAADSSGVLVQPTGLSKL